MRDRLMAARLRRLAITAGAAIMAIHRSGKLDLRSKGDDSPVTAADLAADVIICAGLAAAYPDIPIVSEERRDSHALARADAYFLVDPLDGTREFAARRGEFTVNIALIENGFPVAGIVHAPAADLLYRTCAGGGAVAENGPFDPDVEGRLRPLATRALPERPHVLASRSHLDPQTDAFIAGLGPITLTQTGSSLKFCLIAAGEADLYPRFGPTMEWDTAAGHAVLSAAGGAVRRLPDLAPLDYGKAARRNPGFIAAGSWPPATPFAIASS